jgi:hypothetical protein
MPPGGAEAGPTRAAAASAPELLTSWLRSADGHVALGVRLIAYRFGVATV